jgi:hypothetical protein
VLKRFSVAAPNAVAQVAEAKAPLIPSAPATPAPIEHEATIPGAATTPAATPAAQPAIPASTDVAAGNAAAAAFISGTAKQIRRIVIFYQDGSFADYQPE